MIGCILASLFTIFLLVFGFMMGYDWKDYKDKVKAWDKVKK